MTLEPMQVKTALVEDERCMAEHDAHGLLNILRDMSILVDGPAIERDYDEDTDLSDTINLLVNVMYTAAGLLADVLNGAKNTDFYAGALHATLDAIDPDKIRRAARSEKPSPRPR